MAEFAANILKTEALYYRLSQATLRDGILHLSAGGSAETEITSLQLTNLTEYFRVSYIADRYCDSYTSNIRIKVYAKSKDGNNFNYTFFPCDTEGNMFLQEFQVKATPYEKLTWRIESDVAINVSLWELCPEALDINAQTIIDGVQQSLPRLLYDYNTWPLTVESGEATVGLITFRLLDKTDLQGHFIMSFFSSEAAILTMRFYTNEIEELFAPLTYDIRKGYNSIGIPHCYLHRSAGFYSVMATAQVSAGIVTIPTRGVLYSIDGGYLAARELDVALDVQDLAIRQLSESYGPDEVWLVGIDAGEILVRKRDYNENNPNVAWTAAFSLGQGIAAAIEFNGVWKLRTQANQYTIETEEVPWLFWIDNNGTLFGQIGDDITTKVVLAERVGNIVHAARGYASRENIEYDQGLIVVYFNAAGYPCYRSYSYNTATSSVRWEPEQIIITSTSFSNINVHRLNDYRISFELCSEDQVLWIYSARTYVNQAARNEIYWLRGVVKDEGLYPSLLGYYNESQLTPETPKVVSCQYSEVLIEESSVRSFWQLEIDCPVFISQQLTSYETLFQINGRAGIVSDVDWVVDDITHHTFITFVAQYNPAWMRTQITILAHPCMRFIYDDLIYTVNTNIIGTLNESPQGQESVTLLSTKIAELIYQARTTATYGNNKELITLSIQNAGQLSYSAISHIKQVQGTDERYNYSGHTVGQLGYYKSGEEPI